MAERTWCPSLGRQRDGGISLLADSGFAGDSVDQFAGKSTSAKRDAAVGANSGASAQAISGNLAQSFQRHFQKFDAAIVTSNANRVHWPNSSKLSALQFGSSLVPCDSVLCVNVQEIQNTPISTSQLAVPVDGITELLSLVVHRRTKSGTESDADNFTGLIGLPPVNHVTSMSDVFGSLISCKLLLRNVRQLTVCDASAGDEASALADFTRAAKSLESLSLVNCSLRDEMTALIESLRGGTVSRLNLQRCGIGCGSADTERENILASMADYLKRNKFLTSLDLSYTNLGAEAVATLIRALTESDTRLLPQDVNEEVPGTFDPASLRDRIDPAVFMGLVAKDNDDVSKSEDGEEEDAGGVVEGESLASSRAEGEGDMSEDGSVKGENAADDDPDEEEEREDVEGGSSSQRQKTDVAKEEKNGQRERLRAERQQQKQYQRQVKELARLETCERCTLTDGYLSGVRDIVDSSSTDIAKRHTEERQKARDLFCERRSGWSRLRALLLRGNCLGDSGAMQIALALREEVPLSEDEARERQEAADATRGTLGAAFGAGRAAITAEEAKAWDLIQQLAQSEFAALEVQLNDAVLVEAGDAGEEDEYAKEAPPVVLTNVEGRRGSANEDDATTTVNGNDRMTAEEKKRWEEWAAEELPQITVAPVKKGMRSITLLDLGSCHIGCKGLDALTEVLRTNTVLNSLCLRHNPIGGASTKANAATFENSTGTVSGSFARFGEMLCVNKSLQTLDLGYCLLGPDHVRVLAVALRDNPALVTLGLEGNQLGVDVAYQQKRHSHSYLYDLWMAAAHPGGALRHLHLSHNPIALCLWPEEAVALAAACGQLNSLSLCHVGLQQSHMQLWAEMLRQGSGAHRPTIRALQLARNELAGEAGGKALGVLLQHFIALEELVLDDHPLLGSTGVAAALEHLPATMRTLSCIATGLTQPFVGAAQGQVIPSTVAEQLTTLLLGDIEAPTTQTLLAWVVFLTESAKRIRFLSLWARGMADKETELLPHFLDLARSCTSLLYLDCGFQPQFRVFSPGGVHFTELERILLPRRMPLS